MQSAEMVTLFTTYVLIILAELGDKTQVAVLLFTGNNPARRWIVMLASALALTLCVTIEVTFGVMLAKYLGPHIINRIAGGVFLIIGVVTLIKLKLTSLRPQFPDKNEDNVILSASGESPAQNVSSQLVWDSSLRSE